MNIFLKNSKRGFTLIELLVVMSIVGMLSTVVLAALSAAKTRGQIAAGQRFNDHTYHAFGADATGIWDLDDQLPGTAAALAQTAQDSSGSGNTGALAGSGTTATTWGTGINGSSFNFNPTFYVNIPAPVKNLPQTTNFTVSAWINPTAGGCGSWCTIVMFGVNSTNGLFGLIDLGNTFQVRIQNVRYPAAPVALKTGTWQNVAVSVNGSTLTMYVNGTFSSSSTMNPLLSNVNWASNATVTIGAYLAGITDYFNGQIDSVHLYTQALSSEQIKQLYAQGAAKHGLTVNK